MESNSKRWLWGIGIVVVLVIFWGLSINNRLVTLDETATAQWAQVENQLQRRYDLIPNLVNTVKGYASHESKVFESIAAARAQMAGAKSPTQKIAASQQMESALSRLLVVVENYPNLKADQSFNRLMDELAGSENRISVERNRYNDDIQAYNMTLRRFPDRILVGFLNFKPRPYFQVDTKAKETPKVQF
jgi:LemA protein